MPYSDVTVWQEIAKWFAGIASTIAVAFYALLRRWFGDRFKAVDDQIDDLKSDVSSLQEKSAEHDSRIAQTDVHLEHLTKTTDETRESIRRLHSKFDKHIANR